METKTDEDKKVLLKAATHVSREVMGGDVQTTWVHCRKPPNVAVAPPCDVRRRRSRGSCEDEFAVQTRGRGRLARSSKYFAWRGLQWEVRIQESQFRHLDECMGAVRARRSKDSTGKGNGKRDFKGESYSYPGRGQGWREADSTGCGATSGTEAALRSRRRRAVGARTLAEAGGRDGAVRMAPLAPM